MYLMRELLSRLMLRSEYIRALCDIRGVKSAKIIACVSNVTFYYFWVGITTKNAIKNIFYFGIYLLQCFPHNQSLQEIIVLRTLLPLYIFTFSHLSTTAYKKPVKETEENIGEL